LRDALAAAEILRDYLRTLAGDPPTPSLDDELDADLDSDPYDDAS
jgi:hypothetical protein